MILSGGDPRLHTLCMPVEDGEDITSLVDDLRAAMVWSANRGRPARGLAAPQVGIVRRVFVIQGWPEPFVNPEVVRASAETDVEAEGCLSLPAQILVPVWRPRRVWLRAADSRGVVRSYKLRGRDARCALHELDHLDGLMITDHADGAAEKQRSRAARDREVAAEYKGLFEASA